MIYQCEFPNCNYITKKRSSIDYHHIIPKELCGNNKKWNRIYLCPNHHRLIYIPNSKQGLHSIKTLESIILLGFLQSTNGKILKFIKCDDHLEYLYIYSAKEVILLNHFETIL